MKRKHIIIKEYLGTGDGVLTSVKLAELLKRRKMPISSLVKDVKPFPQILKNVHVVDKNAVLGSKAIQSAREKAEKILKANGGRVLLRPSGTEPLIRIMVEGESESECKSIAEMLEASIKEVSKSE